MAKSKTFSLQTQKQKDQKKHTREHTSNEHKDLRDLACLHPQDG